MLVNLRKGPVKVSYSKKDKCNCTERFEVCNDQMVESGDVGQGEDFRGHVRSVELGHDEILRCQFGFAWRFVH